MKKTLFLFLTFLLLVLSWSFAQETSTLELPGDTVFPEGMAVDNQGTIYVGSAMDGTIYRAEAGAETAEPFITPSGAKPFTTIGMKVHDNTLWIAGGSGGRVYAYDLDSKEKVIDLTTPKTKATFLNDLVVSRAGDVYINDSMRPILFKISAGEKRIESWLKFEGTPYTFDKGINSNGIVMTPDDSYLIVVQMDAGKLWRIATESKDVVEIDLGGETVVGGDGLVLAGQTLYVVQQPANKVATVELSSDWLKGEVTHTLEDPTLGWPATAALIDDTLYVVNSQFDKMEPPNKPTLPFTLSKVPTALLAAP